MNSTKERAPDTETLSEELKPNESKWAKAIWVMGGMSGCAFAVGLVQLLYRPLPTSLLVIGGGGIYFATVAFLRWFK